jgi:hypothetical protein
MTALLAAAITLAALAAASAAPASRSASSASVVERVQYGVDGSYRRFRPACPYGYHLACRTDRAGYQRCGCAPNVFYRPGLGYGWYSGYGIDPY